MPTLYVVATPIGNLEDITLRALRILSEVALIAAEDTRVTRRLLNRYEIGTPLTSYNEHNSPAKLPVILARLADDDVALVTDAGSPGINDPGAWLVEAAAEAGHTVTPVPGPSAPTAALSVSGMYGDSFVYLGFLPKKRANRVKVLASVAGQERTLVLLETPHRLRDALGDIAETLGDRTIAVCRELTKLHEEVFRGTAEEALAHFDSPRGEFVLVLAGRHPSDAPAGSEPASDQEIAEYLDGLRAEGVRGRAAAAEAADRFGISRNRAYQLWLAGRQ